MRRAGFFVVAILSASLMLVLLLSHSHRLELQAQQQRWPIHRQLTTSLGLTDLALWSEARYTRHPSQSDLFSAFQNAPGALDHFPAASVVPPAMPRPSTQLRSQP